MKPHKFLIGDIVRLRSGGPKMTVASLHPDGSIECRFWSTKYDSGQFSFITFPAMCLRLCPTWRNLRR